MTSLYPVSENIDRVTDLFCKGEINDMAGVIDNVYYSIVKALLKVLKQLPIFMFQYVA